MKVKLFSSEGYAGMKGIKFPVIVEGQERTVLSKRCLIVSEAELARVGSEAYQPDEFFKPSKYRGLPFEEYERV